MNKVQSSHPAIPSRTSALTLVEKPTNGGKELPPGDEKTAEIVREDVNYDVLCTKGFGASGLSFE